MKTRPSALLLLFILILSTSARAQDADAPQDPIVSSLKGVHDFTSGYILQAAELLDDEMYAFQPTEEVRTAGQMLAHIADGQYLFCSAAAGAESPVQQNFEATATTKAEIVAALREAFAYCNGVYDEMTDESAASPRNLFGQSYAAAAILSLNTAHNYEHYGNLVTYMRINGIVPPTSAR